MEDEKLIGSTLLLVGIFAIVIGFLIIMVSVALSSLQNSRSGQDCSGRAESDSSQKGANYGETRDYSSSPYEKSPAGKVESKVKTGGVIMLGPIPIIFGSDKESAKTAAILAIILMLLSLLFLRGWLF
jgi:uncharacterized protein (TIGR00304 family)